MRPTLSAFIALSTLMGAPSHAGSLDAATRAQNALNDSARAQRDQAESLRSMERISRDQARRADQDRINAQRDARSMRRFD